jgi:hypothetical protein
MKLALILAVSAICSLTSCSNFDQQYTDKTGLTVGQTAAIAGQTYDQVTAARAANRAAATSAKTAVNVQPVPAVPVTPAQGETPVEKFSLIDHLVALFALWR